MPGAIVVIVIPVVLTGLVGLWLVGERWRLIRRSTWTMIRQMGLRQFLDFSAAHILGYGRWTDRYIATVLKLLPRLRPKTGIWWADHHHSKVLTQEHAEAIIANKQQIPLQDLEQIVPYPVARKIVLDGTPDVAAYECACRHARADSCEPTQVCMIVGQPFVDFVLEHHPNGSRRLTQEEALELLRKEHERAHLHSAWFKDLMLDRFYGICNCCKCCCGGVEVMVKYGIPVMASSGYVPQADEGVCTACGTCVDVCPFDALSLDATVVTDREKCMGCGLCMDRCPQEALALVRDEKKGIPLDMRLLAKNRLET